MHTKAYYHIANIAWLRYLSPCLDGFISAINRFIPAFKRFIIVGILVTGIFPLQAKDTFINEIIHLLYISYDFEYSNLK